MKKEMYEHLHRLGEEEEMSVGEILDFILPEHLELINKEPTGEIRERLHGAIDKDL